jgi:RimJ/RimL family protein N-acetyltransferase
MPKPAFPPIETPRLRLRLLEERDLPLTLAWRNQEHIRRWFLDDAPIAPERHRAWYADYQQRDDDFVFLIERRGPGWQPVGQAALYRVDRRERSGEFGRLLIGPAEARGQGLAREATCALLAAAHERLGLEEVHLEVRAENTRAIALYLACGFQVVDRTATTLRMSVRCEQLALVAQTGELVGLRSRLGGLQGPATARDLDPPYKFGFAGRPHPNPRPTNSRP